VSWDHEVLGTFLQVIQCNDYRERVWTLAMLVNEMNPKTVDIGLVI
jgi:hypothetical protein